MPPDLTALGAARAPDPDAARRPFRLLTFTTLYPSAARPGHGVIVENRLRHLVAGGEAKATVFAPVPWSPCTEPRFGDRARHAAAPRRETRRGLDVHHPRYLAIPRVGLPAVPFPLYRAVAAALTELVAEGFRFDAMDTCFLYPGGVVAVSASLEDGLVSLGADPARVMVLRNGVDPGMFRLPADRAVARAALLPVGLLIQRKGAGADHPWVARPARPHAADRRGGSGPRGSSGGGRGLWRVEARTPARIAAPRRTAPALRSRGHVGTHLLPRGVDRCAAGSHGLWTLVVASPAWGSHETVAVPEADLVIEEQSAEAIAAGVRWLLALLAATPDRAATRTYAERLGWNEPTAGQLALFRLVTGVFA